MTNETTTRGPDGGVQAGLWIAVLLATAAFALFGSYGDAGSSTGLVTSVGLTGAKGARLTAAVEVDGFTTRVRIPDRGACTAGRKISLIRVRTPIGRRYRAGDGPCFD